MKLHGESLTMPEPDGNENRGGAPAWVVILAVVIVAIAAIVAMVG